MFLPLVFSLEEKEQWLLLVIGKCTNFIKSLMRIIMLILDLTKIIIPILDMLQGEYVKER